MDEKNLYLNLQPNQNFFVNRLNWHYILYFYDRSKKQSLVIHYKNISVLSRCLYLIFISFNSRLKINKIKIIDENGDYDDEKFTQKNGEFLIEEVLSESDYISSEIIENEVRATNLYSFFLKYKIPKNWVFRYYQHQIYWDIYWDIMIMAIPTSIEQRGAMWLHSERPINKYLQKCKFWDLDNGIVLNRQNNDSFILRFFIRFCFFVDKIFPSNKNYFFKDKSTARSKVAIELTWGIDLNAISDLYWFKDSGIDPSNVIIYLNRKDMKKKYREEIFQISQMGFEFIDISSPNFFNRFKVLFQTLKLYIKLLSDFHSYINSELVLGLSWWIKNHLIIIYKISFWTKFFTQNNIRAHMSHSGDAGSGHLCQSIAAEISGAINIRSNYSYTSVTHFGQSREFHTYFLWGAQASCSNNQNPLSKTEIITGYPFDYLFFEKSNKISTSENEFSLGLFDTTISHRFLIKFYSEMFSFANNYEIKLVIKPKKETIELIKSIDLYSELEGKGLITIKDKILCRLKLLEMLIYQFVLV
jgi:hypothetical protein